MSLKSFNVAVFRDLKDIPERYDQFFAMQSASSLFLTKHWFENLASNGMEARAEVFAIALEASATGLPEIALVMRTPAGQNGSRFSSWGLGTRTLAGLTNFQSSFYAPLLGPTAAERKDLYQTLAEALSGRSGQWHLIDLNLLDPNSPDFPALMAAFEHSGYRVGSYFYKGDWYEQITAHSMGEYLKSRSKSSRRAIQNYQRKLRRLQKAERVRIEVFAGAQDLDRAVELYDQIYVASWKEPEHFPEFTSGLIRACAAAGSLRMVFVMLDGVPAAVEFAIVTSRRAVMMKTAYDPKFGKESVGSIAIMKTIEHLIEVDSIESIDFGTDDAPYKSVWVKNRRERWGIVLFNRRTLLGSVYWLRFLLGKADQRLRRMLKAAYKALFRPDHS